MPLKLFRSIRGALGIYILRKGPLLAQGIAYSLLLGSMPMLLLTVSAASFFYKNTPRLQEGLNVRMHDFLPDEIALLIMENIRHIAKEWAEIGIAGVLILIIVSKGIFDSLGSGLSGVMDGTGNRRAWLNHLYSLIFTFMTVLFVIVASLNNSIINAIIDFAHITVPHSYYPFIMKGFSILLLGLVLFLVYVTFSRIKIPFVYAFLVSIFIALLWYALGASGKYFIIFTWRRKLIYGVFAGTALFLFWLQIFAHLILLGGVFIARKSLRSKRMAERVTIETIHKMARYSGAHPVSGGKRPAA